MNSTYCVWSGGRGKIHRPRNEWGYWHQSDRTVCETACGKNLTGLKQDRVGKWLLTPWLLCATCYPTATVAAMKAERDRERAVR